VIGAVIAGGGAVVVKEPDRYETTNGTRSSYVEVKLSEAPFVCNAVKAIELMEVLGIDGTKPVILLPNQFKRLDGTSGRTRKVDDLKVFRHPNSTHHRMSSSFDSIVDMMHSCVSLDCHWTKSR
jgi:hypothetical protein